MALERFIPKSPDIFIRNSQDFEVAKFGHLNTIVEYINNNSAKPAGLNGYVQFNNNSALGGDAGLFWDNVNKRLGVGTVTPIVPLNIYNNNPGISSVILVEQDTSAIIGQINQYRKNGSVNLISGAEIGRLSFGGYFNSTYSPFSQVCSAVLGYYGGTGTDRVGGLRLVTWNGGGQTTRLQVAPDGKVSIGTTGSNAKLQIVGEGSTSATTALLVQNSAGSSALTVKDDLTTTFNGSLTVSAGANFRTWSQDDTNVRLYLWSRASAGTYVGTNTGFYHQISNGNSFNLNNNTNNILIGSSSPSASVNDSVGLLSTTISQSSAVAIGASSSVANFAGVAIGVNATTTGGTTNYGGIALGANAKANNYGFAMGYTVANDGEFVAAASISFNQIKPITNVYFGSGRILDDPSGTIRTGVGVSYAINGSGANGTNFAGGDLTLAGGKGTGSGTAGNLIFSTSTVGSSGTTLQTLTERMRITGTGNVGIGTSSPAYPLDVLSSSASYIAQFSNTNGKLAVTYNGDGGVIIPLTAGKGVFLYNNAGNCFGISSTGGVGINTTTPTARLQVVGSGSTSATTSLLVQNSLGNTSLSVLDNQNVGVGAAASSTLKLNVVGAAADGIIRVAGPYSDIQLINKNSAYSVGDWKPAIRFLENGQFTADIAYSGSYFEFGAGISTGSAILGNTLTSNSGTLNLYGGGQIINFTDFVFGVTRGAIELTNTGAPFTYNMEVRTNHGDMYFKTGSSTTRLTIKQAGNVGIGTTTPSASSIVDLTSTTQGFLPPRMTNAQRAAIGAPAVGLMVYCTDAVEGLYIYKSTGWTFVI
jgi:hypothetical protein